MMWEKFYFGYFDYCHFLHFFFKRLHTPQTNTTRRSCNWFKSHINYIKCWELKTITHDPNSTVFTAMAVPSPKFQFSLIHPVTMEMALLTSAVMELGLSMVVLWSSDKKLIIALARSEHTDFRMCFTMWSWTSSTYTQTHLSNVWVPSLGMNVCVHCVYEWVREVFVIHTWEVFGSPL